MWQASHTVLTALSSMGCSATQLYRGITHGSSAMRSVDGPAREPCIAPKTWQAPYPLGEATSKGPEICIGHQEIRSEIKQDFLDERSFVCIRNSLSTRGPFSKNEASKQ